MRTFALIVLCAVFAVALAGEGRGKGKGKHGGKRNFELKCQGETISLTEELKTVSKNCDTKIFGEKKWDGKMKNKDDKKEKPTEEEMKEKRQKMKEYFEKEVKPKMGCSFVCKAKELKLVNDDGKINKENFVKFVEKFITKKEVSAKLIAQADNCLKATPNILLKEDSCGKSNDEIMALLKCVGKSAKQVCGVADKDSKDDDN